MLPIMDKSKAEKDVFADALARGQLGVALVDDGLTVARRLGRLSAWLPDEGEKACSAPLLLHMEESLAALKERGGEIVLPSMRAAPEAPRVTISIAWDAAARGFVVVTAPDHGGDQIDRLLASERREKQLLQQQADAAAARLRVEREKAQEEAQAAAIANERLRIAHDLHDTLVRSMVTLITQSRLIARKTNDAEARVALAMLDVQAREGLQEAREAIARTREERRDLYDLRRIVDGFSERMGDIAVTVEFGFPSAELPRETEQLFAAVLREALRNIELHAGARRVRVALAKDAGGTRLLVEDDGTGFDPSAPTPGHFGVTGMRERARLGGATLVLDSAPGKGTRVTLSAPAADAAPDN
ncbi:histidine kinase [Methylocystis sp. WRRC1]|uniref:sensor histidine kinase n=1 Tax=Methylocystis sp. WRRC1 TaxID=1732014 RepID=UPI001D135397|nr:histidine kinase [Methylocystis sp. WRRC1]MCC3245595.1 histidine kinase [Methylocystis sp. WRRC1]